MNAYNRYKSNNSLSWARIDMLLLVYEKVVNSLSEGIRLLEQNNQKDLLLVRLETQRVLVTIIDGLNLEVGETPFQILRLCQFVMEQTMTDSIDGWRSSLKIMQTLREGFEAIQEEARAAEYNGQISSLNFAG